MPQLSTDVRLEELLDILTEYPSYLRVRVEDETGLRYNIEQIYTVADGYLIIKAEENDTRKQSRRRK